MNIENQANYSYKRNSDRVNLNRDQFEDANNLETLSKRKKLNHDENKCDLADDCGKKFDDSSRVQLLHFLRVRNPFQSTPAEQKIEPKMIEEAPTKDYEAINRCLYFTKKENLLQKGLISQFDFQGENVILDFNDIIRTPMRQRNETQMEMDTSNDIRNDIESYYQENNECLKKIYFERKTSGMRE